jgi:hypothetical protein
MVKAVQYFSQEIDWATLWVTFSQTHLATLMTKQCHITRQVRFRINDRKKSRLLFIDAQLDVTILLARLAVDGNTNVMG